MVDGQMGLDPIGRVRPGGQVDAGVVDQAVYSALFEGGDELTDGLEGRQVTLSAVNIPVIWRNFKVNSSQTSNLHF